ncbi:MAG: GNAT family N-acetyltransferase [Francisellaceae bacterium]|jgi:hypothetical protein|nr:GNAT family N-acetyltransferase [Francisellaceae bacterium]MBT6207628.1 GNAT family N-acetyltransferase [Francisellaceae bacterium]MBT6537856.1 GNAT family N-acetyltransferase [Francisellaceae bacterium]
MHKNFFIDKIKKNALAKFSYIPSFAHNMKVTETDELLLVDAGVRSDMFNIICPKQELSSKGFSDVEQYVQLMAGKRIPISCWLYDPSVILQEQILSLGLKLDETEIGMGVEVGKLVLPERINENLKIQKIKNMDDLHLWKATIKELIPSESLAVDTFFDAGQELIVSDNSILEHYIGLLDSIPVAISATFINEGLVGIWDVITLPLARGQGVGSTMTYDAIINSRHQGRDCVTLSATDAGRNIYERMGFRGYCDIKIYTF